MNSTQRSSRYSSPGNSGYDDDFEADGDDLDGDLEVDRGQVDADEVAAYNDPDAADGEAPAGATTSSYDEQDLDNYSGFAAAPAAQPQAAADEELPDAGGQTPGHGPYREASSSHMGARQSAAMEPSPSASPPPPARPSRSSLTDSPAEGSPASPPPPLPPLNPAVSPYLVRGAAQTHSPQATPNQPPHPRLPPTYPSPSGTPNMASRPTTSHSSGTSHQHAGSGASRHGQQAYQQHQHFVPPAERSAYGAVPALALTLLQQASSNGAEQQQQQLAAAISQSVDVMRASEHVRQLQAAVEALTAQVVAAERGRSAAELALVELAQQKQEQEGRLNEAWEAKLLEKQREVQQLRTKVQQLESQGIKGRLTAVSTPNPRGSHQGASSGGGGGISPEEAAALRKEMEQTEVLLRGYQLENEAATRRIKELEESLTATEHRAAEEVLRTERAVLLGRDDAGRRNVETASKLARVLALEKELAGVREEAQTREVELKAQLEKLRVEKKALEARAGGVDLKAMADGDVLVRQLRQEMEAGRQATQTVVQEMQSKLAWYAENQEMLNKNDSLVAEQRETIQQLQSRLVQYEGQAAKGPAANRVAAAQARVRELEAQVEQLHKALRSRAPANSLAAVVAAARPTNEENQLVSELGAQVEELEERLRLKDEDFELQLRTYQQQFERLKAQYSERATRLEAVTKVRGRVKELERQLEEQKSIFSRRVRDLEAKLKAAQDHGATIPPTPAVQAPQYLSSAVHTPTKGQQQAGAAGQGQGQGLPPSAPGSAAAARRDDLVPASYLRARELEVKKLQTELERRSKQVSDLHIKLGETESRNVRLTADLRRSHHANGAGQSPLPSRTRHDGVAHEDRPVGPSRGARQQLEPYPPYGSGEDDGGSRQVSAELLERVEERCGNLTVENGNLRGQVQALTREVAALRQELEQARASAAKPSAADTAADTADLRRKLEVAELALVTVQRSTTDAVERGAMAASEHQRSMLRLHDEVAYKEGLKWQERLASIEQELRTAQQRCEQLEAELMVSRSRGAGSWSPEASAFAAMERRLDDMARDMAAREAKWRAVLQDTQSLHGVQSDIQRRKWESMLATKEGEVQATRAELQSLLQEVAQVQELQKRVVAKQQQRQTSRAQDQH